MIGSFALSKLGSGVEFQDGGIDNRRTATVLLAEV
jgi:hypothetical protein